MTLKMMLTMTLNPPQQSATPVRVGRAYVLHLIIQSYFILRMDIYSAHLHDLLHKELCLAIRIGAAPCWVVLVYRKVFRLSIPFKTVVVTTIIIPQL